MAKLFVIYGPNLHPIDVERADANCVDFEHILDSIRNQINDQISAETHIFEVFRPLTKSYKNIEEMAAINGTRFVTNLSTIKVSDKPIEEFKCSVDFFDTNNQKHSFDVVVNNCIDEAAKYHKLMDKFWDMCGKQFPVNYTFEVFDEQTNEYLKLNKRKPNIPNGSLVRIRPTVDSRSNTPDIPLINEDIVSNETFLDDCNTKDEPKITVKNRRRPMNPSLSDWVCKELNNLKIDDKVSTDEDTEEMPYTEWSLGFDSDEDRDDHYLTLCVGHCLKGHKNLAFEAPMAFFQLVCNQMKNEYKYKESTADKCRLSFEDLFHRYYQVLKSARDLIDAQNRLKCFQAFDSLDLSLFLTPEVYQTVDYWRYRLWYGIDPEANPVYQYRTYAQPFVDTSLHPLTYPFAGCPLYSQNPCHCRCSASKAKTENVVTCGNSKKRSKKSEKSNKTSEPIND